MDQIVFLKIIPILFSFWPIISSHPLGFGLTPNPQSKIFSSSQFPIPYHTSQYHLISISFQSKHNQTPIISSHLILLSQSHLIISYHFYPYTNYKNPSTYFYQPQSLHTLLYNFTPYLTSLSLKSPKHPYIISSHLISSHPFGWDWIKIGLGLKVSQTDPK